MNRPLKQISIETGNKPSEGSAHTLLREGTLTSKSLTNNFTASSVTSPTSLYRIYDVLKPYN